MIVDRIAALALIRRYTLRAAAIPEADADEPGAGGGRFVEGVKGSPLIVGPLPNRDNYTDCLRASVNAYQYTVQRAVRAEGQY